MQVGQQRGEIARLYVLRQVGVVQRVGVEVAIRAFAHAPGQVNVERQRGQHAETLAAGGQGAQARDQRTQRQRAVADFVFGFGREFGGGLLPFGQPE